MMKLYPPHVHWNPNCLMVKPTPSASQPRLDAFLRIFHLRATAYGNLSQLWHSSWHMVHQNCNVPWATTSDTSAGWWFQPLWKIWVRQLGWLFPIYIYIYGKTHVPNHQSDVFEVKSTIAIHCCRVRARYAGWFFWIRSISLQKPLRTSTHKTCHSGFKLQTNHLGS